MARPVKCPYCEEKFDRDKVEFTQYKKRYYHQECYEKTLEEEARKKYGEMDDGQKLSLYICNLYGYSKLPARVKIQINQMKKEHGYTDSGILKTLQYFFDFKGGSVSRGNGGVGIVPYIYEDAKEFYYKMYRAQEQNKGKNFKEMVEKTQEIKIKKPKRRQKKIKLFSMEGFNED